METEPEKIENIISTDGNVTIMEEMAIPKQSALATYSTPLSIIVAGIIIAGAIMFTHFSPGGSAQVKDDSGNTVAAVDIKKVKTASEPFIGDANAPVTIAYWSDYQCPFCKQFETTTFQQIMDNYVKTGKAKIVFKDFQFLGNDSITDALYARAVWDLYPAQYFAWREAMFNKQDAEGDQGFGDEASVKALTATITGIDAIKVAQATIDKKDQYQKQIDVDKTEGGTFGIKGTPGFIIGKQVIAGAVPYAQFSQAIDGELNK